MSRSARGRAARGCLGLAGLAGAAGAAATGGIAIAVHLVGSLVQSDADARDIAAGEGAEVAGREGERGRSA